MKSRIIRDILNRRTIVEKEAELMVLRYLNRNTDFQPRIRNQAQQALSNTTSAAFPTHASNRCLETGKGRGIMSKWRLCRFQFRLKALSGGIPGVHKSSW
ncbi:hypothetical protein BB561_002631 [Smittium simulii]|uniref:Ribosomal protein S14 n=1 Tax=Smittium simulii TaxID=133385 RepID=A0A2T9YQ07_9FUNG|nr:hypothetical protein BB561_002631 [Smittium simulii]